MEVNTEASPRSIAETASTSAKDSPYQDTPLTDAGINETEALPNDAPQRKLSYTNGNQIIPPQLSEVQGADWPEVVPSIWDMFLDSVAKYPDNLALASVAQKGELLGLANITLDHDLYRASPYVRWSNAEFIKGMTRLIDALQKHGVEQGSSIFTFMNSCAEVSLIVWAAVSLGCNIIPIHPRNLLNKQEATHILTTATSSSHPGSSMVFVQTEELAKQVSALNLLHQSQLVVVDGQAAETGYLTFRDIFAEGAAGDLTTLAKHKSTASQWATIIFTSGTTALPKGVKQDAPSWDLWVESRSRSVPFNHTDSVFFALPTNHSFFSSTELGIRRCGGATVFPGPSFAPQDAPDVFAMEGCTYAPLSPTMAYALAQVAKEKDIKFCSLKSVTCGGAKLSAEIVKNILADMGSQAIEIIYGTTEIGMMGSSGEVATMAELLKHDDVTVGRPSMGATVKVCAPGDKAPLPRHTEGEVHLSSRTLSHGYVGSELPESFYSDESGAHWFATGDAGIIDDDGFIYVVGRVKDMIIRGGVNISPAAIEFTLGRHPETEEYNIQIVGRPDTIAGEVPIAVSGKPVALADISIIQDTILRDMGPVFLPEEVLSLEQLGLTDFPKTMLGKAQKAMLKSIVAEYIEKRDAPKASGEYEDEVTANVQKVWIRTIGHAIDLQSHITDYADSISIMRVRDRLARELGTDIHLADMLAMRTGQELVELVRQQKQSMVTGTKVPQPTQMTGPDRTLGHQDLIHLTGDSQRFPATQAHISDVIAKVGLAWEDVQEITPASDFTQIMTLADITPAWTWKFSFLAKSGTSKQDLRKSLEVMLSNNVLLASFMLWNRPLFGSDIALHVMFKHNQKLFDQVFRDYGKVATRAEFADMVNKPYEHEMSILPGLLTQFILVDIEENDQCGAIMVAHHVPVDASYMQMIFDDFDVALGGATKLEPHTPYKIWADSYCSLKTSHEARVMVDWQVNRLSDVSSLQASVFPPRPSYHSPASQHAQELSDNGYHTDFPLPGIVNIRRKHPALSAPTIVKAAWALMNIRRSGSRTAIFPQLQADRRRFPFIPPALDNLVPPGTFSATSVAGPTLQEVVNIIPLRPAETVLEFLHWLAADQEDLNKYAAAPLKTVLQEVGPINSEIVMDIFRSQIFNWTPGLGALQLQNPNQNYEPLSSFIQPRSVRLITNVDVGGVDDETVYMQVKSPLYDVAGLESVANEVEDFLLWLCKEENWNKPMGQFEAALRKEGESRTNGNGIRRKQIL